MLAGPAFFAFMGQIPLHNQKGAVVAHSVVDDVDVPRLLAFTWRLHPGGYAVRYQGGRDGRRAVFLHHEVLGLAPSSDHEMDHVNRDRLDNRGSNLRYVTHAENLQNKIVYRNSKSGVRGVYRDADGRWRAQVKRQGQRIWQAHFPTLGEAAVAVRAARKRLFTYSTESAAA